MALMGVVGDVLTKDELREATIQAGLLVDELNRRRVEDKLKYYKPHLKQLEFHKCAKRNRWALGGNRTGKTEVGAVEVVWMARGVHPYRKVNRPTDGWVVSLTSEVQRDVAQAKVLSYINPAWIRGVHMREGKADDPEHGVIDYLLIESVHGGISRIGFKSCDQGRERFQGTSKDYVWFDEEPPREIYDECLMRIIDVRGDIWGTMTPLKGLTWVYEIIWLNERKNPEIWTITMAWEDNPYLNPEEIKLLEATLTEEELESRREGKFVAITGLVYKEFRQDVHVIPRFTPPREWQQTLSIDPGIDKPLSCHWYATNEDGDIFVVAEWYRAGWGIAAHMREIERISKELGWKRDSRGWLSCIMDAAADQRSLTNEVSVAAVFREHHLNVNTQVNKSRFAGIERVKEYLFLRKHEHYGEIDPEKWPKGKPKLFICDNCPEMIREIKKYRWKLTSNGAEEPEGVDDHAMDEMRYFVMTRPSPAKFKEKTELSIIQRDKQAKLNRLKRQGYARRRQ